MCKQSVLFSTFFTFTDDIVQGFHGVRVELSDQVNVEQMSSHCVEFEYITTYMHW